MATTLQSPGVNVSVIDESFYTPAAPGTVPMIFVATGQDKSNASQTGTAQGTTKSNVGKVWTITSQRDLTDTFGSPKFYTDASGNPIHGGELNEYGLQAAYSLLAVSSKAYVVRADVDLSQLTASASEPKGDPLNGTYWFDTGNTNFGISEWDAVNSVFTVKKPLIINDESPSGVLASGTVPASSFGTQNSYAVVATSANLTPIYYKNKNNTWVQLGSNQETNFATTSNSYTFVSTAWQTSWPVVSGSTAPTNVNNGNTFFINGQSIALSSTSTNGIATTINNLMPTRGVGAKVNATTGVLELYADANAKSNGSDRDGKIALSGSVLSSLGLTTGTYAGPVLTIAPHTQVPQYGADGNPTGSAYLKTTSSAQGASWIVKYYNGSTKAFATVAAPIYQGMSSAIKALDAAGGKNIPVGTLFVHSNYDNGTGAYGSPALGEFKIFRRVATSPTTVIGSNNLTSVSGTSFTITPSTTTTNYVYSFTLAETLAGASGHYNTATITVASITSGTASANITAASVVSAISAVGFVNISATITSDGYLSISHSLGGDINFTETTTDSGKLILNTLGFSAYNMATKTGTPNLYGKGAYDSWTFKATNWKPLVYEAKASSPYTTPADGTLWYNSQFTEVDIMYHDGSKWVGYLNAFPLSDPNGPQVKATAPTLQSDGTPLVAGDIWIDSSDSELYGQNVYIWNASTFKWIKQDVTDHTTPNGWVFKDARWSGAGDDVSPDSIQKLLTYNYVDPDCPDPADYPKGVRLWNLRRSGFNIKYYDVGYIDINANSGKNIRYQNEPMDGSSMTVAYNPNRWVSASPNNADGSGTFGRKAQRSFVVKALKSLIDTNQTIRDTDTLVFNLIACPGYPEAIQNMIAFNASRSYTGFVVGDTPFRLAASGTSLGNWGNNTGSKVAIDNNDDGAVSHDQYMAMFYPSGYTNDNSGNNIVVPPSHMMLRTIALSDQKSYQWFAPAGIKRGAVDNVTAVGYISNGAFVDTALPNSVRDVLAGVKINPIAKFPGVGIVNFGNYTRATGSSSLDRINVSRLVAYLRRQLDILARPFLFEPNDRNTRAEIKNAAESLLVELVGQRALYDYIVVCDQSNNSATQIDKSELHMDIAIEPVKAVEFIYIPLRLKNTGSIKAGL
jgi:Phage tail sheath C-terminal domain